VVVITADHGEEFGERQRFGHGQSLHHEVVHVPLVIAAPARVPSGQVVRAPASLRDLPATVVDLLGLEQGSPFPGRSLARHWSGPPGPGDPAGDVVFAEIVDREPQAPADWRPPQSVIVGEMLYIRDGDGREELFNLADDPAEINNLVDSPAARPELERCRSARERLGADGATKGR
jgi:arylsulfatase A-like enzyme